MKSLSSALRVLLAFAGNRADLGVIELTEMTGMTKSSISKILKSFREAGLLMQNPQTRRYAVGIRAYALGAQFISQDRLARETLPLLRKLAEQTGLSARISVLDGDEMIYLLTVEGAQFMDSGWQVGRYLPLHSTVAGKVMLAFLDPERVDSLLATHEFTAITPHTITNTNKLRSQIAQIRVTGVSVAHGETVPGLVSIGVPVFGRNLIPLGVLAFAAPDHAVPKQEIPGLAALLHASARVLSQRMDCQVYPFGAAATTRRPRRPKAA